MGLQRARALLLCAIGLIAATPIYALEPGLKVTFESAGSGSDTVTRPNLWLYVPAGQPPTSFVPSGPTATPPAPLATSGPFSATFEGFVSLDLRSQYRFYVLVRGGITLQLNGTTVLETNSTGDQVIESKPIRLNKGTNALTASFHAPAEGDSMLRIEWAARGALPLPIPDSALSHLPDAALTDMTELRLGRELFIEHRCAKCHRPSVAHSTLDLEMDAPSFEGIGSRRNSDWLVDWVANPKGERPSARMPALFHGANRAVDAQAVGAYLSSLKSAEGPGKPPALVSEDSGKALFDRLHCAGCHAEPGAVENDAARISLAHVRRKFAPGTLAGFLLEPEAHFAWTGMPNFKLMPDQAANLAAYLLAHSTAPEPAPGTADSSVIQRGRELVSRSGCLNCHSGPDKNRFSTKPLHALNATNQNGCLSRNAIDGSTVPHFGFSEPERRALAKFLTSGERSLQLFDPVDFAVRRVRQLRCGDCHGRFDGFPGLGILGGKLKPEWAAKFISGEVEYKPRPWLAARMPAFRRGSTELAQGLAMLHGHAPVTPPEPTMDMETAAIGRQLVSAVGGLSCNACHGVGEAAATQVFEGAGINLAYSADRLLKPFYRRWLLNPLAIDPTTKMPVYFDEEGRSPLTEFYEGDGLKQIDAMWEYIRLGERMQPPPLQ